MLPSKEMRSLPCAAHLSSPRCYFYLTFQGLVSFFRLFFCCDSTGIATSLFPSLPPFSFFLHSFLPFHALIPAAAPGPLSPSRCAQ